MHALKRLVGYLGPYWRRLIVTSVLLILSTGLGLLPPLFQRQIVDEVIGARDLSRLVTLVAIMIGVYAAAGWVDFGDPSPKSHWYVNGASPSEQLFLKYTNNPDQEGWA